MKLQAVICYWQFIPSKTKRLDCKWKLMESFGVDCEGRCITTPSTGGGDRQEWDKWLNKKVGDDEDDYDWQPIMGRAVTIWGVEGGVRLLGIHPPKWSSWLSNSFYTKLCELPNWSAMLENGFQLYLGTAREAEKYLNLSGLKTNIDPVKQWGG